MNKFQIDFTFNSNNYTASVERHSGNQILYYVYTDNLTEYNLEIPFIITANREAKKLTFPPDNYPLLRQTIAEAIRKYCLNNNIQLIDLKIEIQIDRF